MDIAPVWRRLRSGFMHSQTSMSCKDHDHQIVYIYINTIYVIYKELLYFFLAFYFSATKDHREQGSLGLPHRPQCSGREPSAGSGL